MAPAITHWRSTTKTATETASGTTAAHPPITAPLLVRVSPVHDGTGRAPAGLAVGDELWALPAVGRAAATGDSRRTSSAAEMPTATPAAIDHASAASTDASAAAPSTWATRVPAPRTPRNVARPRENETIERSWRMAIPSPRRRATRRRPITAGHTHAVASGVNPSGTPSAPQCDATGSGSRSPIVATTIHGSESTTADHATARTRYHLGVLCRGPNRGRSPVMPPPPSSDEPCLHCSDGRIGVLPPWGPGRGRGSWAAPCGNGQTGNVAVLSAVRAARGVASDAPNRV